MQNENLKFEVIKTENRETEKPPQVLEETEKQKKEREYKENISRLQKNAEAYIKEIELARLKTEELKTELELPPPKQTLSLKSFEEKRAAGKEKIKDKLKKRYLKRQGINEPERFLALVDYLESNIKDEILKTVWVKKSELVQKIGQYEKQGYKARYHGFYEDSRAGKKEKEKIELRLEREIPFKFSFKKNEVQKFSSLLDKANDPVQIIERLKEIGFTIDAHTFKYNLNKISDFVSSPEIGEILENLSRLRIKTENKYFEISEYAPSQSGGAIKNLAALSKKELWTEENLKKLFNLSRRTEININLNNLEDISAISQDEKAVKALSILSDLKFSAPLQRFYSLQEAGLIEDFIKLRKANIDYSDLFLAGSEEFIQNFTALLNSPKIKEFLENKDLREFSFNASRLLNLKIFPSDIDDYKRLKNHSNSLEYLEFLRENEVQINQWQWAELWNVIRAADHDKEKIFNPEFQRFIVDLREKLRWSPSIYSFNIDGLKYLFASYEKKEQLFSVKNAALINFLGDYRPSKTDLYLQLGETSNSLPLLRDLKETFDYLPEDIEICQIEELDKPDIKEKIFSEKTTAFVKELEKHYRYKFSLSHIQKIISSVYPDLTSEEGKKGAVFHEKILNPKSVEFIKKTFINPSSLQELEAILEIDEKLFPLFISLSENFDIRFGRDDIAKHSDFLNRIHADSLLRKQLFSRGKDDFKKSRDTLVNLKIYPSTIKNLEIMASDFQEIFYSFRENPSVIEVIYENLDRLSSIPKEKRGDYLKIFLEIDNSPSQEIQRLKDTLLNQLVETDKPAAAYKKIEDVFVKNYLPMAAKIFIVFDILHPPPIVKRKLTKISSPVLYQASERKRRNIFYRDLLKIHIDSANRSLRQYLEIMREGQEILKKSERAGMDNLEPQEKVQLNHFLNRVNALFINSALAKNLKGEGGTLNVEEKYRFLKQSLKTAENQSISERLAEMFLRPLGLNSFEEALERMRKAKFVAHKRGLRLAEEAKNGFLEIEAGDLMKGVDINFISGIFQNGSAAKEFLGYASTSATTPFDTDLSLVLKEDLKNNKAREAVNFSLASGYGDLLFVVKNRGQFQITSQEKKEKYEPQKLELFCAGAMSTNRHYGIRTGFPTTEIDFLIAKDDLVSDKKLENIFYEISQNGYYIPVADADGKIIFTPELYKKYRRIFNGLERYDGDKLEISFLSQDDPLFDEINKISAEKKNDEEKLLKLSGTIKMEVKNVLKEQGVDLKEEFDPGLLGADFLDIGSTGRETNMPGSYDFDWTLKLDSPDFKKAGEIAQKIKERMEAGKDESHSEEHGYYQLRLKDITKIGKLTLENPIDIDIGFAKKSDLSIFGSHDAIYEKLKWIKDNLGDEAAEQIIANIILCKQLLNKGEAYKRVEHGGFGGIGVENWILANNGNIRKAFQTFREAAYENGSRIPFEKFKEKYKILNAGMNVKRLIHDNYIENLQPHGYEKMLDVLDLYSKKIK